MGVTKRGFERGACQNRFNPRRPRRIVAGTVLQRQYKRSGERKHLLATPFHRPWAHLGDVRGRAMNEIASKARRKGRVRSLAERIGKLTAAVVALGALVNAGVDVLARIRNVPTNKFEQSNEVLYKQHYQETPVVSQPYDVRVGVDVTVRMLVQLYSNGDVLVQYDAWTQRIAVVHQ